MPRPLSRVPPSPARSKHAGLRPLRKSLCSGKVLNEAFVHVQRLPLDTKQGIIGALTADGPKAARTFVLHQSPTN